MFRSGIGVVKDEHQLDFTSDIGRMVDGELLVVLIRWVPIRDLLGALDPRACLGADLDLNPAEILTYFVRRWQIEVTLDELRPHLGIETQRQWSDTAIAQTTLIFVDLTPVVTLAAYRRLA